MGVPNQASSSIQACVDELDDNEKRPLLSGGCSFDDEAYEAALGHIGWSQYHLYLAVFIGWCAATNALIILSPSLMFPAYDCDPSISIDSAKKGYLTGAVFLGMILSGCFWGGISDWLGRKPVIIVVHVASGLCLVACNLVQSYTPLLLLHLATGLFAGGLIPNVSTYNIEFHGKNRRGRLSTYRIIMFVFGTGIATALAWLIIPNTSLGTGYNNNGAFTYNSWRVFALVCGLPSISIGCIMPFLPESPKLLAKVGRIKEVNQVLAKLFYSNMKNSGKVSPKILQSTAVQVSENSRSKFRRFKHIMTIVKQLLYAEYRWKFMLSLLVFFLISGMPVMNNWFTELFNRLSREDTNSEPSVCFTSNATSVLLLCNSTSSGDVGVVHIDGDVYMRMLIIEILALPGYGIGMIVIDRYNRKFLTVIGLSVAGVSLALFPLLQNTTLILVMAGLFSSFGQAGYAGIAVVSLEMFPTSLRVLAFSLMLMMFRVGAFVGNVVFGAVIDSSCSAFVLVLAGMLCAAAVGSAFLPDTRDEALM